jgi:hypothetical protein
MSNKIHLYEAKTLRQLKDKLETYSKVRPKTGSKFSSKSSSELASSGKPTQSSLAPSTTKQEFRCYNCNDSNHRASECKKPKREKGSCFTCGAMDHKQTECPANKTKSERRSATTENSTHVVQANRFNPYVTPVTLTQIDEYKNSYVLQINSLIDTGSPVSLIKTCYVRKHLYSTEPITEQFSGVKNTPIKIIARFETKITVQGIEYSAKFYVVPDDTMSYGILLGRDFILNSNIKLSFDKSIEISKAENIVSRVIAQTQFTL